VHLIGQPDRVLRSKNVLDLEQCVQLLRDVHAHDGYPSRWPTDPRRFVTPPYEDSAWVAVHDDEIVGHIALHRHDSDPALAPASRATGLDVNDLAVIARLLVAPARRRQGVGAALLAQATTAAYQRGWRPVLDVAQHYAGAIALYEACGWTRGEAALTIELAGGHTLDSWLYLGPSVNA